MDNNLKVAVVTGASRGLGSVIALTLGKSGYNVALNYLSSEAEAKKTADSIGSNAIAIKADVSNIKQVREMAEAIYKKWGRVDVLINNAGITKDNLLVKTGEEEWDKVLSVNLKGCFNTIKMFSHVMIKTGGHIINVSSYSGLRGRKGQAAYSASKAAILGLTYTAAKELAEYNIRVNALLPGYMQTDMGIAAEKAMEKAKAESIIERLSDPHEVAGMVLSILKTENITGQIFCVESRAIG